MNKENTLKLLNDFPNLYEEFYKPMTETCMCWGFEHGDGWFDIVYDLSKKLTEIAPDCRAVQVKEKFGGLRFYTGGIKNEIRSTVYDLIDEAERMSYNTCEKCGSTDNVTQTEGWIYTLCPKCLEERKK